MPASLRPSASQDPWLLTGGALRANAPASAEAAATAAEQAARTALTSAYHLAILTGPCAGLVVPVPETGTMGRDEVLTDPLVSREHLRTRVRRDRVLLSDAGSVNGTWRIRPTGLRGMLHPGPRQVREHPASLRPGARLRTGSTVLELRSRPTDLHVVGPATRSSRSTAITVVVSVAVLLAVLGGALATGRRGVLGLLMLAPMVLMTVNRLLPLLDRSGHPRSGHRAGWCGARRRSPDPAGILLAAAARHPWQRTTSNPPGTSLSGLSGTESRDSMPVRGRGSSRDRAKEATVSAWTGERVRRRALRLHPGDRVSLRGHGSVERVAWWAGQVLAQGSCRLRVKDGHIELSWDENEDPAVLVAEEREPQAPGSLTVPRPRFQGLSSGVACPVLQVREACPAHDLVTDRWWQTVTRICGAVVTDAAGGLLPTLVRLESLTGEIDRERVAHRWEHGASALADDLSACLGVGMGVRATLDLVQEGPHALLAGTTGSGKSELLTSWLLQLCLAQPPDRLALVLVDYKGGAAFEALRPLPHTAGVLTDLDPAGTSRALSSLHAEVRRRERLLGRAGVKDVRDLSPSDHLQRLVVVVDEFATLADEAPEVLQALVRVAVQGRSLGIHLVLATQRPSGVVSPTIRANTSLRICLRVLDAADSRDVLGHDGAARLGAVPGRVMVSGTGPALENQVLQAPWAGSREHVARLVREIACAASDRLRPWRPWAQPLPVQTQRAERPSPTTHADRVELAVTDLPDQQRLGTWQWQVTDPLLVLGSAGSGRTTALSSAALGLLSLGRSVHLCGAAWSRLAAGQHGHGAGRQSLGTRSAAACQADGTVVGPQDSRRLARLWCLAAEGALGTSTLLLDDVETLVAAVDEALGPGEGHALLDAVLRTVPAHGGGIVASASLGASMTRWATRLPTRLVLGASQASQASVAGLPRGVVTGPQPGRGVLLSAADTTACQVLLASETERQGPPVAGIHPGLDRDLDAKAARAALDRRTVTRLEPIPLRVPRRPGTWAVGGDAASPLRPPARSVLVVGPPGSGRSTTLRALRLVCENPGTNPPRRPPLVVDDLDTADAEVHTEVEEALRTGIQVLATSTTERCAATYRGALALLRERADLVVLWPGSGPAQQVAGVPLRQVVDWRSPRAPGRGALVSRGLAVPLQVVCSQDGEGT